MLAGVVWLLFSRCLFADPVNDLDEEIGPKTLVDAGRDEVIQPHKAGLEVLLAPVEFSEKLAHHGYIVVLHCMSVSLSAM